MKFQVSKPRVPSGPLHNPEHGTPKTRAPFGKNTHQRLQSTVFIQYLLSLLVLLTYRFVKYERSSLLFVEFHILLRNTFVLIRVIRVKKTFPQEKLVAPVVKPTRIKPQPLATKLSNTNYKM